LNDGDELKIGRSRGIIHLFERVDSSPEQDEQEFAPLPAPSIVRTDDREEGIVVSLPLAHRAAPPLPLPQAVTPDDRAGGIGVSGYSDEFVQSLAAEFLKMQRTLLDQTQTLMQIVNERLEQAQAAARDGMDPLHDSTTPFSRLGASDAFLRNDVE